MSGMTSRIPGVSKKDRTNPTQTGARLPNAGGPILQSGEDGGRKTLGSSPELKAMITQVVNDCVEPKLEGLRQEPHQLRADLNVLRGDIEQKCSGSCLQDVDRLDKDVLALRDFTQKNSDAIWKQMAYMLEQIPKGDASPKIKEEDDPLRDDAKGDRRSPSRGRTSRTPTPAPSRRSRRSRKSQRKTSSHRRQRRETDWSDESDVSISSDDSDTGSEGEAEGIRVADRDCRKAMSVKTYRLDNRSSKRTRSNTSKLLKGVQHLFTGDRFDGSDPITVLHFLEELQSAFNDAQIAEGDAKHIVRYFLTGEAAKLFKGLSPRDRDTYPRIIRWLLRTYVRETMLQDAREKFLTRSQRSNESELDYSKEIRVLARRCGGMIPDRDITQRFVRGLQPAIRTQVQARVSHDAAWSTVVAIAADHGNAHREAVALSRSRSESRFLETPRRRSMETGRALVTEAAPAKQKALSSDDELFLAECMDEPMDSEALAVMPQGSRSPAGGPSWSSRASSPGSSSTYWTARRAVSPASITYVPQTEERKVMLPPGIPFPARAQSTTPKAVCWGCGKEGHFLSGCKTTDRRIIDLTLEGLRARKRERASQTAAARVEGSQMAPQFPAPQPRVFVVKDDQTVAPTKEDDPPVEEDKSC